MTRRAEELPAGGRSSLGGSAARGRAVVDHDHDNTGIMIRSFVVIWGLAAVFFLVVLLTTRPPGGTRWTLLCADVIGFTVLGLLVVGRDRLPWYAPDVCAYLLYMVVGAMISAYQDPDSPYALAYLWLAVHTFYFLPWPRAAPQVGFIALNYAASLAAVPGDVFPVQRWAVTVFTTVVICVMVGILRARVDSLVTTLAEAARTDPLTGLRNRRAYDEILDMEMARSDRSGQPFSLVIGDLDHFKWVNDRFGHPYGDRVLVRVARELMEGPRKIDMAVRLGGEEFALVLPNTDCAGALLLANRLRGNITQAFATERAQVSMSFGIACYPQDGSDADALFHAADTALMAAKAAGRDRALVYRAVADPA